MRHVLGKAQRLELPNRLADRRDAHPGLTGEVLEPAGEHARLELCGDGRADVPSIIAPLERAAWDDYDDLEIFSDDGAFGEAYPDSLRHVDPAELVRRSRESFIHCWDNRKVAA